MADYPDEEALAVVEAVADRTSEAPPDLVRELSRFLDSSLIETYGVHVDRDWDGFDLIANTETYIHEALRTKQLSTYTLPALESERLDDRQVRVTYSSDRQLCDLAKDLIHGVGEHHGQPFRIDEEARMFDGTTRCELVVTVVPEARG